MEDLELTARAIIDADTAHLGAINDEVLWERRGPLQTLSHQESKPAGWWRRLLRLN